MEESPCEFFKKLDKEGLVDKTSASLSEVVFGKDEFGDKISAKVFLDYTQALENKEIKATDFLLRKAKYIKGLIYEGEMYDLVTELCSPSCPNFVRSIGTGRCTKDVLTSQMIHRLNKLYQNLLVTYPECPVMLTFTERIGTPDNLYSLTSFPENYILNSASSSNLVFQLVFALTAMQKHRIMHYDLHTGNILVKKLDKSRPIEYLYKEDGKEYLFQLEVKNLLYIFDWDYGYCEILGNNPRFRDDDIKCIRQHHCNSYVPGYDLYSALCNIGWGIIPSSIYDIYVNTQIFNQDSRIVNRESLKYIRTNLKKIGPGVYELTDEIRNGLRFSPSINYIVIQIDKQILPVIFIFTAEQAEILMKISTYIDENDEHFYVLKESKELENLEFIPKDFRDNIISCAYGFAGTDDGRYCFVPYIGHKCRAGFITKDMPLPSEVLKKCFTDDIVENKDSNTPRFTLNMDEKFYEYKKGIKTRKLSKELPDINEEDDYTTDEDDLYEHELHGYGGQGYVNRYSRSH